MGFCKDVCKSDLLSAVNFTGSSSSRCLGTWSKCGKFPLEVSSFPVFHRNCLELEALLGSGWKSTPCVKENTMPRWGSAEVKASLAPMRAGLSA